MAPPEEDEVPDPQMAPPEDSDTDFESNDAMRMCLWRLSLERLSPTIRLLFRLRRDHQRRPFRLLLRQR